jgi:hypothetical protein
MEDKVRGGTIDNANNPLPWLDEITHTECRITIVV